MYYNSNRYGEAVEEYKRAAEISPDVAQYHFDVGDAYFMQWKYTEAVNAYSEAIDLDSSNVLYLSRRAICYSIIDDMENSKSDILAIMNLQEHGNEIKVMQ